MGEPIKGILKIVYEENGVVGLKIMYKLMGYEYAQKSLEEARNMEKTSDEMQEQISTYLAECTKHELSFESSINASAMMRLTNELESIGDSCFNLFLQIEKVENKLKFTNEMDKEIFEILDMVFDFTKWNDSFIIDNVKPMTKKDLDRSMVYENAIDNMRNLLLDSSRKRLVKGSDVRSELLFMDIVKHLEHIGDYSLNISQALQHNE